MIPDYTRIYALAHAEWDAAIAEMNRLAARLPDGQDRMLAFKSAAQAASDRDGYLTERMEVHDGVPVTLMVPGPLTLAFLEDLERRV